jgi:ATP-dependent DNA ligase
LQAWRTLCWNFPGETVIDGEVVALDQEGKPAFHLLVGYGGEAAEAECA